MVNKKDGAMSIMFIDFAFAHILGEHEMYVHTVSKKKI